MGRTVESLESSGIDVIYVYNITIIYQYDYIIMFCMIWINLLDSIMSSNETKLVLDLYAMSV